MDIKEEILAQMDSALRPEFDKAIDNTIEGAFKEDVKTLGFMVANSIKCQWEVMKPHLFYAYCLGVKAQEAKAQAVPDNSLSKLKNTITAHYDRINDAMHEEGYDDKSFGQLMALDFVEEVIDEMIEAQAVLDQLDVNSILHDIDCYFDSGLSNTERTANNLIQSIYEKLSGEVKAQEKANEL